MFLLCHLGYWVCRWSAKKWQLYPFTIKSIQWAKGEGSEYFTICLYCMACHRSNIWIENTHGPREEPWGTSQLLISPWFPDFVGSKSNIIKSPILGIEMRYPMTDEKANRKINSITFITHCFCRNNVGTHGFMAIGGSLIWNIVHLHDLVFVCTSHTSQLMLHWLVTPLVTETTDDKQ